MVFFLVGGRLASEYEFLPRVIYKNIILSLAKWSIKTKDFTKILKFDNKNDFKFSLSEEAIDNLKKWRKDIQLPRYVILPDGDNELFVDIENNLSVQTLFSVIKKLTYFHLV
jgi:hypothetical protein